MSLSFESLISSFIMLWAVIDPIGTIPVFAAVTYGYDEVEKKRIAKYSTITAFFILLFFLVIGEVLLQYMGVPLSAFQVSGGIILFVFALDMIFGDSKPEGEIKLVKSAKEAAIFPLAIPSIAGPGAMLAIILLTDNSRHSIADQSVTAIMMIVVLFCTYIFMRLSGIIVNKIGNSGAIIISKVMGVILASIAATNILIGIKKFFDL